MKLNRRQLRRLIESAIYEQASSGGGSSASTKRTKEVIPKEVREELQRLRFGGFTALAVDEDGNEGIAIRLYSVEDKSEYENQNKIVLNHLKKVYGDDRVAFGTVARLLGGSAGIKQFGAESGVARMDPPDDRVDGFGNKMTLGDVKNVEEKRMKNPGEYDNPFFEPVTGRELAKEKRYRTVIFIKS